MNDSVPVTIARYSPETDWDQTLRVWNEVGWMQPDNEARASVVSELHTRGRSHVAKLDGQVEAFALSVPGTLHYLGEDIPFSGVTNVATSPYGRMLGLAKRLTALSVAEEAAAGALVSGLGMFEQGFYNKLGFGTGCYEHRVSFHPAWLTVPYPKRPPSRLTVDDWEAIHKSRLGRMKKHGAVSFPEAFITRSDVHLSSPSFGLGYYDEKGNLTHHIWCRVENLQNGPYEVRWMAYRNYEEFLELLGVLRSLGDQVHKAIIFEPQGIQMQDFISRPMRSNTTTFQSRFSTGVLSVAWWQVRINDFAATLARTHLKCESFRFNLNLSDPIADHLENDQPWRGIAGEYVVTVGPESGAVPGNDPALPTLRASVNALSRLWLGVLPATSLGLSDTMEGPPELLGKLDEAFRLPRPVREWDF